MRLISGALVGLAAFCVGVTVSPLPAQAQRNVSPSAARVLLRKNSAPIPLLRGSADVAPTKAALQSRFDEWKSLRTAGKDKVTIEKNLAASRAVKLTTLPPNTEIFTATATSGGNSSLVEVSPKKPITDEAYLVFSNVKYVDPKSDIASVSQVGEQTEGYGDLGNLFDPTANVGLGFAAKKGSRYLVTISYRKNSDGINKMIAYPNGFKFMDLTAYFNESVSDFAPHDMEFLYEYGGTIDGWDGFLIAFLKPADWYFYKATIREVTW